MKITKTCKACSTTFECDKREHNRGNGHFCSISCATKYNNENRILRTLSCKHCGNSFYSNSIQSKYCSISCKQKNYRLTSKHIESNQRLLLSLVRTLPCEICGWEESIRDVHHILPVSKGGKNEISNLISLCPNHHRMVHRNLISQDSLYKTIETRTISSSYGL